MNLRHFLFTFRIKSAIKITLGGFICLIVGNVFHLESAYLSVLFLYLIMLMYNGQTFVVGIQCLAGGVVAGALSLLIANVFVQSGIVYLLLMGSLIFLIMLLLGKYFLPALLSAIVASMSMFVVIFESLGQAAVTIENYLIQMFLGVFTAWVIDELIWPRRSESALYTTLASVYRDFSVRFAGLADGAITSRSEDAISLEVFNNLVNLVDRTDRESRDGAFYPEPFMKLTAYAKGVYIRLDVLEDFVSKDNKCLELDEVKKVLDEIFSGLSSEFDGLARAVEAGSEPCVTDAGLENASASLGDLYMKLNEVEGD
ncbi:MAG: FUSC family protein, partial [Candidatus Dadabacteria bacterium]|nr:FUSC family protein [Candidatus Dadabacteria bacterium]